MKASTINWRIYRLVQRGILKRVGRGVYALGQTVRYVPHLPETLKRLHNSLEEEFPFLDVCLWTTANYSEFMLHQPFHYFLLVETEKDATESVFFFMKDRKYSVFLEPSKELLSTYLPDEKETWIVKPLISGAPLQKINHINTTTLEKLLVDLICDTEILYAHQGAERERIIEEAYAKYTINANKMLRYADRRGKKSTIKKYLNEKSKFRQ